MKKQKPLLLAGHKCTHKMFSRNFTFIVTCGTFQMIGTHAFITFNPFHIVYIRIYTVFIQHVLLFKVQRRQCLNATYDTFPMEILSFLNSQWGIYVIRSCHTLQKYRSNSNSKDQTEHGFQDICNIQKGGFTLQAKNYYGQAKNFSLGP